MREDNKGTPSPWHIGERALQRLMGVGDRMEAVGRAVLRPVLVEQHREFYPLLPFVALGTVDAEGAPWATIRAGRPGFLHSPDPATLVVETARDPADPAEAGMADGDAIGLVGVDLMTRRRNRLNGTVQRLGPDRFSIGVGQSFGNCPRYIQQRSFEVQRDPAQPSPAAPVVTTELDETARRIIAGADTFFVASYAETTEGRQVDASHRGGKPGFVRIDPDGTLTIPDFNGNLFFNTIGNFLVNPRAGLVFVDWASGGLLQLTGRVEVVMVSPEIDAFEGAERLWRVKPEKVVLRPEALPLRWTGEENGLSPYSLMTGNWQSVG